MNSRTFFTIVIKLIGFYLILMLIKGLIDYINPILFMELGNPGRFMIIFTGLFPMVVYTLLIMMCFFQTNYILSKLKIENDLEIVNLDNLVLYSKLFRMVIIVIGFMAIIDSLPKLCQGLYNYYLRSTDFPWDSSKYIIQQFISLFCGVFILTYNKQIYNYIEFRRFTNNAIQESDVDPTHDGGVDYLKKLNSLIESYTKGIKSNKKFEEILFILDRLCKTREEGLLLLKNYSDLFEKDLLTQLKKMNYSYDKLKINLRVFIDLEIVEPDYPHNVIT